MATGPKRRIRTSTDQLIAFVTRSNLTHSRPLKRTHLCGLRRGSSNLRMVMCILVTGSTIDATAEAGASTTQEKSTTASGKMTFVPAPAMRQYREMIQIRRARAYTKPLL